METIKGWESWIRILERNSIDISNTGWSVLTMSVSNLLDVLEKQLKSYRARAGFRNCPSRHLYTGSSALDPDNPTPPGWRNIAISSNVSNCWNSMMSVVSSSCLKANSTNASGRSYHLPWSHSLTRRNKASKSIKRWQFLELTGTVRHLRLERNWSESVPSKLKALPGLDITQ